MDKIIEISNSSKSDVNHRTLEDYDNNKDSKVIHNKKKKCFISIFNFFKSFFMSPDAFLLTALIILNCVIIIYEFYYGFYIRSLHLISDSVHGIIHVGSFCFALYSYIVSRKGSNFHYTYGYSRIETLSAFINCFFLLFLAGFAFMSRLSHLIEDNEEDESTKKHDHSVLIDLVKFAFNLLGLICFCRYSGSSPRINSNESHMENFHSLFLHFLLDGLANLSNLTLFFYDHLYHYKMEIFFSGFILILSISLCKPVLQNTGLILLQAFPIKDEEFTSSVLREISVVDGVLNIKEKKFWGLHWGYLVCSLKIYMRNDINREESLKDIHQILRPKFSNICIEFVFDK